MQQYQIELEFLSYWQTGSGTGAGARSDSLVIRDETGLPFVPGRTLKGIFREAFLTAENLGHIEKDRTVAGFGSDPAVDESGNAEIADRYTTTEGQLSFESARLPEADRMVLSNNNNNEKDNASLKNYLFRHISQTAIESESGIATDHTLRRVEVSIPLKLYANVVCSDSSWQADLQKAAGLIRAMGLQRKRGFGRVQLTVNGGRS